MPSSLRPSVIVSRSTAGDAAGIVRFMRELSGESRKSRFFSSMTDASIAAELIRELAPSANAVSLIARARDSARIVGHAIAIRIRDGAYDVSLAVADAHQRQGIGTLLLERMMYEATALGVRSLEADVLAANHEMLHIFARAGYRLVRQPQVGVVHARASLAPAAPP